MAFDVSLVVNALIEYKRRDKQPKRVPIALSVGMSIVSEGGVDCEIWVVLPFWNYCNALLITVCRS